jgi:hypothetical protein
MDEETSQERSESVKRSQEDEALLTKHLQYTASIDEDALMKEDISEWPEFKLSNVELDALYEAIPRLAGLPEEPMVTNAKEMRVILLRDLRGWQSSC